MFKGMLAAASAIALSATPVMAAASPATALSLRSAAELQDENGLGGGGLWAALVGIGVAALVVLAVTDDDDNEDLPESA